MRKANKAAFTSRRYRELMQNNRFECYKHMDANPSEDVAICPHHHAFYEIIFVVDGDFFYEVEGRPYHLSHGDVILIDELQFHHGMIYHSQGYERYALWIHPKYMQRLSKRFPKLDPQYCFLQLNSDNNNIIHLDDASFSELQQDLSRLFQSYWSKTPSDEVLSESYFAIILTKLNQLVHRMYTTDEIPTISATSSNQSSTAIDISAQAWDRVYNQQGAVGSPGLLEQQFGSMSYDPSASPSPLFSHPDLHRSVSAVDLANSGARGRAEAHGQHINPNMTSSTTVGSAPYGQSSYNLLHDRDNIPDEAKVSVLQQALVAAANNQESAAISAANHAKLAAEAAKAASVRTGFEGDGGMLEGCATRFAKEQSMGEMLATVESKEHDRIFTHGSVPNSFAANAANGEAVPANAALPSNIASTGKAGVYQPYGYGYQSHDNLTSAHEALNYSYDGTGFLNAGVAATLSLVSFASSLGTNVHNPPQEDVSIFDPDPEIDNTHLNQGGMADQSDIVTLNTYRDAYSAGVSKNGNVPMVSKNGRVIPSEPIDMDDLAMQSADNMTTPHNAHAQAVHNEQSFMMQPNVQASFNSSSLGDVINQQLPQGASHKGLTVANPAGQGQPNITTHDFQTMLMQGEGQSPAPMVGHNSAVSGSAENVEPYFDDDEMHLNLKLSERLKLSALLKHINLHINENLSLDEISTRFGLSKFYLTRRFKELTGLSLHQFIVKKRLTRARYLISVGNDPYKAAVEAGFNNYSHFSRTFKSYFGQNPSTIPQAQNIHAGDQQSAPVTKVSSRD